MGDNRGGGKGGRTLATWGALVAGGLLVFCTGDDPQATDAGCLKNEDCKAGAICDLPTGMCLTPEGGVPIAEGGGPSEERPVILGQPDEFSVIENELGLIVPTGVVLHEGRLIVADANAQRILVYKTVPTTNLARPDVVLGRPSLKTVGDLSSRTNAQTLFPAQFCDAVSVGAGSRLLVADTNRHRGLLWNLIPETNNRAADLVVGAATFDIGSTPGAPPPPPSERSLAHPCSLALGASHLAIADHSNNRVLLYPPPSQSGAPATVVLGQAGFGGSGADCPQSNKLACLRSPASVFLDGARLWVSDNQHNRVLVWNQIPTANDTPADLVLGQDSPSGFDPNHGGAVTKATLAGPRKVFAGAGKVLVADEANHRVLVWNQIPTANGTPADLVLGQATASGNLPNRGQDEPGANTLASPFGVATDGTRVVVADRDNARVLIWNTFPMADGAPADVVLGRPTMTATRVREPSATTYDLRGVATDGTRFVIGDLSRVLVWDHVPTGPNDAAGFALGRSDLTSIHRKPPDPATGDPPSASRFNFFGNLWVDATRTVAAETFAHRVLVWTKPITASGQPADLVLGQATFAGNLFNETGPPGTPSASRLGRPAGVHSDGTRLVVSDTGNHRVLVWTTFPTTNQQPADVVLGQADMISAQPNRGGATAANTLRDPGAVFFDEGHLFVSDRGNHRILVWNGFPTATGQAADIVLGQPDVAASAPNSTGLSASGLRSPGGISVHEGRLYVADTGNHRILRWSAIPTRHGAPADFVHGQKDFTSGETNAGDDVGPGTLSSPGWISTRGGRLWIADVDNKRIVGLPLPR